MKDIHIDFSIMLAFISVTGCLLAILVFNTHSNNFFQYCYVIYKNQNIFLIFTLFICGIICFLGKIFSDLCFGKLNESDQATYNEMTSDYLGNTAMTAISFPYVLQVNNLIAFMVYYAVRGMSWAYHLNSETNATGERTENMPHYSFGWAVAVVAFILFKLRTLCNKFSLMFMSFNGLLAFEYFMTFFSFVKQMLLDYFSHCSPAGEFGIKALFLVSRILVAGYYANNLLKFRMPMTYIKMIVIDLAELKKISIVFFKYLKLCKELNTIEDVEVENQMCAICTEDFDKGKKLGCGHIFHTDCLKMWCERESTCPICRKPLSFTKDITIETETEVIRAGVL